MKLSFSNRSAALPLLLLASFSAPLALFAQENGILPTNKILYISREYTKPGKDGTPHQMTEAAFLRAEAASKASQHYLAAVALSGPSRALFMYSYPSFAAMEAQHAKQVADNTLSSALDRASAADGDLLSETDSSIWMMRDEMSLNPGFRAGAKLEEFTQFAVRPGHGSEWEKLVKLVIEGYKKGVPDAHWAMYQEAYGSPGGRYLVITTLKSAADIDTEFAANKQFVEAMGEDGMKKLEELEAACVESRQDNLFVFDPKMSYPPEAIMKADPDFWKQK
jgi:hypothetical protein